MIFTYPAIVHKESGYWIEFPNLPGCFTQGDTIEELIFNATEAMECYVLENLERGETLAAPSNIMEITVPEACFTTIIQSDVDLTKNTRSVKKTLTIPAWLNEQALARNLNFSQILQEALLSKLANC